MVDLQLSADALFNEKPKHTLFYDNENEVIKDRFLNKKTNRDAYEDKGEGKEDDEKEKEPQSFNSKALLSKYKQKEKAMNDLNTIYKGLTEQKELIVLY